jgi:hypothetical protein
MKIPDSLYSLLKIAQEWFGRSFADFDSVIRQAATVLLPDEVLSGLLFLNFPQR